VDLLGVLGVVLRLSPGRGCPLDVGSGGRLLLSTREGLCRAPGDGLHGVVTPTEKLASEAPSAQECGTLQEALRDVPDLDVSVGLGRVGHLVGRRLGQVLGREAQDARGRPPDAQRAAGSRRSSARERRREQGAGDLGRRLEQGVLLLQDGRARLGLRRLAPHETERRAADRLFAEPERLLAEALRRVPPLCAGDLLGRRRAKPYLIRPGSVRVEGNQLVGVGVDEGIALDARRDLHIFCHFTSDSGTIIAQSGCGRSR
jgi:hypothetical protein